MTMPSRREFGRALAAGLPLAMALRPWTAVSAAPLLIGVSTSSFREFPRVTGEDNVDEVIKALRSLRAAHIELATANIEPAPPSTAPFVGGSAAYPQRVTLTPEQVAATNAGARTALRAWRGQAGADVFQSVRRKVSAAGLTIHACAISYNDSFTDEEIDATMRQAKALGVSTMSSPLTMKMAARLAPFAARHQMRVAIHNQVDGNAAGLIATPQLRDALALSPAFALKLDIGNLTAANCDAVATLREHLPRVSHVLIKDRLRNGGASQHFGEGDTPIVAVLGLLQASPLPIPVLVDYDYVGLRTAVQEVAECLSYLQTALARQS